MSIRLLHSKVNQLHLTKQCDFLKTHFSLGLLIIKRKSPFNNFFFVWLQNWFFLKKATLYALNSDSIGASADVCTQFCFIYIKISLTLFCWLTNVGSGVTVLLFFVVLPCSSWIFAVSEKVCESTLTQQNYENILEGLKTNLWNQFLEENPLEKQLLSKLVWHLLLNSP